MLILKNKNLVKQKFDKNVDFHVIPASLILYHFILCLSFAYKFNLFNLKRKVKFHFYLSKVEFNFSF